MSDQPMTLQELANRIEEAFQPFVVALRKALTAVHPAATASLEGLHIDRRALAWMKGWKP